MRYTVVIHPWADADVRSINEHISRDAPGAAERFVAELIAAQSLALMPRRYPIVPGFGVLGRSVRSMPHRPYRIRYTIRDREVIILRIWHSARGRMRSARD